MRDGTRAQHLARCKKRALAYLPDNPTEAVASLSSDLRKHPETEGALSVTEKMYLALLARDGDLETLTEWINELD